MSVYLNQDRILLRFRDNNQKEGFVSYWDYKMTEPLIKSDSLETSHSELKLFIGVKLSFKLIKKIKIDTNKYFCNLISLFK